MIEVTGNKLSVARRAGVHLGSPLPQRPRHCTVGILGNLAYQNLLTRASLGYLEERAPLGGGRQISPPA